MDEQDLINDMILINYYMSKSFNLFKKLGGPDNELNVVKFKDNLKHVNRVIERVLENIENQEEK